MERFRGGLVFKAHRLLYHSTLGARVIKRGAVLHAADEPRLVLGFQRSVLIRQRNRLGVAFRFQTTNLKIRCWA